MANVKLVEMERVVKPVERVEVTFGCHSFVFKGNQVNAKNLEDDLEASRDHHRCYPERNSIYFSASRVRSEGVDVYGGMTVDEFEIMVLGLQSMLNYMKN